MVLLADACKGHLADLLIEDWAKPFKKHLKKVHSLILFIINHGPVYGLFASYDEVLALLIPAETRFATEIICARSLHKDKGQVRKLFVDPLYDEWHDRQERKIREVSRDMKQLALSDDFWHINVCSWRLRRLQRPRCGCSTRTIPTSRMPPSRLCVSLMS